MTHAFTPDRVLPHIESAELQTINIESLESENSFAYTNGMACYPDFKDIIEEISRTDVTGVFGYYDAKWEDSLDIDRDRSRHMNDADEVMSVYIAEHLARGSEMSRFGSKGIMGYHVSAKETQETFLAAINQPWFLDVYKTELPQLVWLDFMSPSLHFLSSDQRQLSIAMTLDRLNTVYLNQWMSTWGLLHTLVHELAHCLVRAPHSSHGRFFRFAQLWLWSHIDKQLGTLMGPKIASMYDQFALSWEPVQAS